MPDNRVQAFADRLGPVFMRTAAKLPPEAGRQLRAMVTPESLLWIAAFLVGWIVGHAFGIGEIVDVVIGISGLLLVGTAIFSGLDEILAFARATWDAKSDKDLDVAADHLARAIAILGITAVMAVLFKGRPQTGRLEVEPLPPVQGLRYKPTVTYVDLPKGVLGSTSAAGDIEISSNLSLTEQRITLLHEQVHQFLTPKFFLLRQFRIEMREGSYFNSSLYRYIEEAMAETIAQIGVQGFSRFFRGIRFPVKAGYVFIEKAGADAAKGFEGYYQGKGIVPEGAALIASGAFQGFVYRIFYKAGGPIGLNQRKSSALPSKPAPAATPGILKGAFTQSLGATRR